MSLVLSVCNHRPSYRLCLCISPRLIIIPYIFIDLVIYSSPVTQHTHTYTHNYLFFPLSIFETPSYFAFTVSSPLVHRETDPNSMCSLNVAPSGRAGDDVCVVPLWPGHWGWGLIRAQSLPGPRSVASLRCPSMRRQHAILALRFLFFFFTPPPPSLRLSLQGWPRPTRSMGRRGRVLEPRDHGMVKGSGRGGRHMSVCLAVCLLKPFGSFFPFQFDFKEKKKKQSPGASWAMCNISVHQEKERAEQWCNDTQKKKET